MVPIIYKKRKYTNSEMIFESASTMAVALNALCTPGMGVILWGVSPLYVNPVNG